MPNPTLKMDSVTVLDKDSDGVHFKNSLIHSSTTFPAGHILQAVNHKQGSGTSLNANSTDWKGTGFGKSITLSSASHKVLILVSINGYQGNQSNFYSFNLYRHTAAFTANGSVSGTQLFNNGRGFGTIYGNTGDRFANVSASLIDSPETTTEIYYNVCHKEEGGQGIYDGYNQDSTITLLEIAG